MSMERESTVGEDTAHEGTGSVGERDSGPATDEVVRVSDSEVKTEISREPDVTVPEPPSTAASAADEDSSREPLLPEDRATSYRERWDEIQTRFVDDPRSSVEEADRLVMEVVQQLQASFTSERDALESQWQHGDDVQTEDLRVALTHYRSFFSRLLSA